MTDQRTAIVTGAAHPQGIGRAIVRKLVEEGYRVLALDLESAEGFSGIESESDKVRAFACDVTARDEIESVIAVAAGNGGLHLLVNNAGVAAGDPDFERVTEQDWNLSLDVNLTGTMNCMQTAIPLLKKTRGAIVNVASLAGLGAIEGIPANYTASKFAVVGLTKQVALQLAADGVRCNAVCPGSIVTQMYDQNLENLMRELGISREEALALEVSTIPLGYSAPPTEVANAVAYLASPAAAYVTGVAMPVAGGMAPGL
jgi:3-oxoacyl-[acyl-carrier protein] reductase